MRIAVSKAVHLTNRLVNISNDAIDDGCAPFPIAAVLMFDWDAECYMFRSDIHIYDTSCTIRRRQEWCGVEWSGLDWSDVE